MADYIKTWEKSRKQGRLKYSIIQGLIFGVIVTLIKDRNLIWDTLKGNYNEIQAIFVNFSWLFLGATIGYYIIVWWWKEKLYKKEQDKLATTKDKR